MSSIDQYRHRHLGFIDCPSRYDFVANNSTRKIAVYELLENVPLDEKDFNGKKGDIILGGGKGEAPAIRISIPEAFVFFTQENQSDLVGDESLFKAFWTPTASYIFCDGFSKLGWTPQTNIELWLAKNVCLMLKGEKNTLGFTSAE